MNRAHHGNAIPNESFQKQTLHCIPVRTFLLGFRNFHDMRAAFKIRQGFFWGDETTKFGVSCGQSDATKYKIKMAFPNP
jgi:hypothetical protein